MRLNTMDKMLQCSAPKQLGQVPVLFAGEPQTKPLGFSRSINTAARFFIPNRGKIVLKAPTSQTRFSAIPPFSLPHDADPPFRSTIATTTAILLGRDDCRETAKLRSHDQFYDNAKQSHGPSYSSHGVASRAVAVARPLRFSAVAAADPGDFLLR